MKIDAYFILTALSVMVVLSYFFNYLASKVKIPSVLLLILSGLGLQYISVYFGIKVPATGKLLEILGIAGLIFIVLEASLDLHLERSKLKLIGRAFIAALGLLALTSALIALLFVYYYETTFRLALLHAIPLSVISSAIAIPSVASMDPEKKEFVIYESTFSDILGIIAFNYILGSYSPDSVSIAGFGRDLILIVLVSVASTLLLIFLLDRVKTSVRFFLTFAIIILIYSFSKSLHLPSLILVLSFGLVINNYKLFDIPIVHRFISFDKLNDVLKEMKMMTAETAFIIRTFFFLLFGYSINLSLLKSEEVFIIGVAIIAVTLVVRVLFLRSVLKLQSTPLALITPRGLITVLLFYSIPQEIRLEKLSDGVLFVVIVLTGIAMTIGLLINRNSVKEEPKDII